MSRTRLARVSVLGFDLSLSAPAFCHIPAGWRIGNWEELRAGTLALEEPKGTVLNIEQQYRRLVRIVAYVRSTVEVHAFEGLHCFVENYAFSASSSSVTRLAELGGAVRVELVRMGHVLRPLSASTGRKLILGKVPQQDQKIATHAAIWKYGAKDVLKNGDEVDAFVTANAGLAELGQPFLSLA